MKSLRLANAQRNELGMTGRFSMTNSGKRIFHKSILKSTGSNSARGGTPNRRHRNRRAVSFCDNLERVHFFDPNQTYKRGRGGGSVDFRISL